MAEGCRLSTFATAAQAGAPTRGALSPARPPRRSPTSARYSTVRFALHAGGGFVSIGPSSWASPDSRSPIGWARNRPPAPCRAAHAPGSRIASRARARKLGGRGAADPRDPASSMCDPCREKFAKATDVERPCDRPGCDGTWTWTATAQMEAFADRAPAARAACAPTCEAKLGSLADKALPCAVPGCTRTSVFSRRAQLLAGAPEIAARRRRRTRCGQCEGVYRKLKDRPVSCGINGCKQKWIWTADEQIQAYAPGCPTIRRAGCATTLQGRLRRDRRPRGPLPDLGLQEHLDLGARRPAGRLPRGQAAAQGAAPDVRELHRHLPGR